MFFKTIFLVFVCLVYYLSQVSNSFYENIVSKECTGSVSTPQMPTNHRGAPHGHRPQASGARGPVMRPGSAKVRRSSEEQSFGSGRWLRPLGPAGAVCSRDHPPLSYPHVQTNVFCCALATGPARGCW